MKSTRPLPRSGYKKKKKKISNRSARFRFRSTHLLVDAVRSDDGGRHQQHVLSERRELQDRCQEIAGGSHFRGRRPRANGPKEVRQRVRETEREEAQQLRPVTRVERFQQPEKFGVVQPYPFHRERRLGGPRCPTCAAGTLFGLDIFAVSECFSNG